MHDRNTLAMKYRLMLSRGHVPRLIYDYGTPEFHHGEFLISRYVNLEKSKARKIPESVDDALDFIYLELSLILKDAQMPPKNRKMSRDNMPEMISSKLTDAELLEFETWYAKQQPKLWNTLTDILLDGHKQGVSWDAYNDCFIASLTGRGDGVTNDGRCLTSRSQDWIEAVALNLYKHLVIYQKGLWINRNNNEQRG